MDINTTTQLPSTNINRTAVINGTEKKSRAQEIPERCSIANLESPHRLSQSITERQRTTRKPLHSYVTDHTSVTIVGNNVHLPYINQIE